MSAHSPFDPGSVTLSGDVVLLVPLDPDHANDLSEAGRDESIWTVTTGTAFETPDDTRRWIDEALAEREAERQVPFAIVERSTGRAVGSTRYGDIRREHRGLEIGWTWIGVPWQRTAVNTECKLLLLEHAFEILKALRVQFKTDRLNERSQRAIERIGAAREGILRSQMIMPDGRARDSVYFSILDREWPEVKDHLLSMLLSHRPAEA